MTPAQDIGVYVHWPYCARICPYCDFNVVRARGADEASALVGAIVDDLRANAALTGPRRLTSIFFGGGTPSLLEARQVETIIDAAKGLWTPSESLEVTLEANPTDAEAKRFSELARAGVNRLSLGVQSLDDGALRFLGRNHDAAAARRAVGAAMRAFERVSIDLIYALPGQGGAAWARELKGAIELGTEHISPYQLTIETGTAFHRAVSRGAWRPTTSDLAADLFETTAEILQGAGFDAYEISNHARGESARSRHNLTYWRGGDYVGVGPGAHGRLTLCAHRWASLTPGKIGAYIERVRTQGCGSARERLSAHDVALERLLMGLRTSEGVARADLAPLAIADQRLRGLAQQGLARLDGGRITIADKGRLVIDRITADLAGGA